MSFRYSSARFRGFSLSPKRMGPAARLRIRTGEGIRNHATDIVPDHVNVLHMQMYRQLVNVFCHIRSIVTTGRRSRAAYAAQVNCHDCELLGQLRHDAVICVPVFGKTVQQNDGGPSPAAHVVECGSVHLCGIGDESTS